MQCTPVIIFLQNLFKMMVCMITETNLGTTKCVFRAKFAVKPNLDDIALLHLLKFTIVASEATHLLKVNI